MQFKFNVGETVQLADNICIRRKLPYRTTSVITNRRIGGITGASQYEVSAEGITFWVYDEGIVEAKVPTSLDDALGMVKPKQQEEPTKQLGGIKYDGDKPDYSLLPLISTEEVVKVWTFGKKKYSAWNWTLGFKYSRPLSAALRHITAWASGQSKDPETGLSHLAHAICCLQMLLEFEATGTGEDDRRKTYKPESGK